MQLIQISSICMDCSQLPYKLYFICLYQKSYGANIKGWLINIGWWVKLLSKSFIFNSFPKISVTSHYLYNCATILYSCLIQVIHQVLFNKYVVKLVSTAAQSPSFIVPCWHCCNLLPPWIPWNTLHLWHLLVLSVQFWELGMLFQKPPELSRNISSWRNSTDRHCIFS